MLRSSVVAQKRCFSSTPAALAKRRQLAIQRKKANIARQTVLKAERSPTNFDPIIGRPTDFTRSLVTPNAVWSANSTIHDSLYFPQEDIKKIQKAVEQVMHDREKAAPRLYTTLHRSSVGSPPDSTDSVPQVPTEENTVLRSEEELMAAKLSSLTLENERKTEASSRILSLQNSNARTLRAYNTAHAIREFGRTKGDTGSAEVQAAILTVRILAESVHIANNKKDVHGFRGFRGLVHQRQKILKYLRRESVERYYSCIERLGLQDQSVVKEITM